MPQPRYCTSAAITWCGSFHHQTSASLNDQRGKRRTYSRGTTQTDNDNRSINTFPAEILCKVFFDATDSPYTTCDPPYLPPHRANLVLLEITAVCKHWRLVALGCAILWTKVAFSTSEPSTLWCARLFLARSKEAELSVYICDSERPEDPGISRSSEELELLENVSAQTHRISTCQLSSLFPDFWRYWASPAPNLRNLLVQGHGTEAPLVFRGEFPQLKTLTSLRYVTWPLGNYATLTHARLRNHGGRVTLTLLLATLAGCTALEGLTLEGYRSEEQEIPRLMPILLPRLRQIDLISCDSSRILEYLEAPSLRRRVVVYDSDPQYNILHSLPTPQRNTPYLQGIRSLKVDLDMHSPYHHIVGFRADGSTALYIGAYGVPCWAKWNWIHLSFAAVASFSPFSNIRSLTLTTDALTVPWELWLPNLNNVVDLTVSCPRLDHFLVSLLTPCLGTRLPSLHNLTLRRFGRYSVLDYDALMAFVFHRYKVGRPLRQLRLTREDWGWIRRLDETWTLFIQSQCKCLGPYVFV